MLTIVFTLVSTSPSLVARSRYSANMLFSLSPFLGESVGQGSDAGSMNGDDVNRGSLMLQSSVPLPAIDPLSPTGYCSSLGGVPRCLSPVPSDPFPSGSFLLSNGSHISGSVSSLDSDASGSTATSTDSHPISHRGGHHDVSRCRRMEAEARKAEKKSLFRSPERQDREAVLSPERRSVTFFFLSSPPLIVSLTGPTSCPCSLDLISFCWFL